VKQTCTRMLRLYLACLALLAATFAASEAAFAEDAQGFTFVHDADLAVMARDGTRLSAHVFRAANAGPLPVILSFTPYAVQELLPRARFFAQHGYVFVAVSARGRGDSEGAFDPFSAADGRDAADAIGWAARQPWSNGNVGMWGGSYLGYAQWAAAGHRPPALKTIVPAAAVFPGVDYPAWRSVGLAYQFQWLQALQGRSDWFETAFDDAGWAAATQALRREGRAFSELAARSGRRADIARQWLAADAARWNEASPSAAALAAIDIPVLAITGQFDGDQRGALEHYRQWQAATPAARDKGYLLIGPWDHGGTRNPGPIMAGEPVDPPSVIDLNALHLAWYDWTLKQRGRPDFLRNHLSYFQLGTGLWHYATSLDDLANGVTWQLAPGDPQRGRLMPKAAQADYSYRVDTRTAGLANPIGFEPLPGDVRDINALTGDGLVFDSAPLDEPMDLAGMPRFSAWVASSRPDGDIFASLIVIAPDGKATRIGFDVMRLRHRDGPESEKLMQPGKFVELRFDQLGFVARRLAKGSRLRLALHSNPSAILEMNYGGGGKVAEETEVSGGLQVIRIRQRADMPAALFLPLRPISPP